MTFADINKIKELLNGNPKISIEDGMDKVLRNFILEKAPVWTKSKIKVAAKIGLNI